MHADAICKLQLDFPRQSSALHSKTLDQNIRVCPKALKAGMNPSRTLQGPFAIQHRL